MSVSDSYSLSYFMSILLNWPICVKICFMFPVGNFILIPTDEGLYFKLLGAANTEVRSHHLGRRRTHLMHEDE